MGSEVSKKSFTQEDLEKFRVAFLDELEFVKDLFTKSSSSFCNSYKVGYELEACILDQDHLPSPINHKILDDLEHELFTNELAKYDLEINGNVFELDSQAPQKLSNDLDSLWAKAQNSAKKFDSHLGLFGVLPSLKPIHFNKDKYQSNMHRYSLVSQRLKELRHEDVKILFHGDDEISLQKDDVMFEALGTSLQVHLQIPFEKSVEYYHAALFASVVLTGFSANSSLVLGKRGWHESRIAIFEQSVDTRDKKRRDDGDEKRVHFAYKYIDSWIELFEQNKDFKIIFADLKENPKDELHHFNLHNGTVWRWVRPILNKAKDGKYSLRLELRSLPSGPTLQDTKTNIWFLIGLISGIVKSGIDIRKIPFEMLKDDFYNSARHGFEAKIHEPKGVDEVVLSEWILSDGIKLAKDGLREFGIENYDELFEEITQRAKSGQNGASWQLNHHKKHRSISKLMQEYMKNFNQNIPVHRWGV
jgi:hypothetical protein